ncbi:elicitor-responsive protein 3-like [Typha latifolia]|uniref:elicitor-responsive protein 3-like n=1 Tax=Typha latifolia TaxID=4733 RepID=UPI003C2F9ED7
MSDVYGIHGQTLEVIILRCNKLKNTGLFTKQNPYVIVEYNNCKFQTRTCTDGDTEPVFDEKFHITLIAGILDMNIYVWNSNSVMRDTFIGSGRVQLNKVITEGFDDSICVIKTNGSKYAGDVKLIMHFSRNPLIRTADITDTETNQQADTYCSVQEGHWTYM